MSAQMTGVMQRLGRMASERQEVAIVVLVVLIVAMLIVPLPTVLVDFLIACNIVLALLIFMGAFYVGRVLEFSSFPAVLLISTLFRLALSISTTRLILMQGDAGQIITTFGEFVVGDSLVVGLVIFAIVTIVQFIVIAKGSERVAEVVARFSLDAMPGKQMSIDSDARTGLLDNAAVTAARERLAKESQLYGSFDGAMKFVKGDAIAGIVIIVVNLVGGIATGMLVHDMKLPDAVATYALLSIGDGLVAQIPALLIAVGAGFVVTRVADDTQNLGQQIVSELFSQPPVLLICALLALGVGLLPGFPFGAFAGLAVGLAVLFYRQHRAGRTGSGRRADAQTRSGAEDANHLKPDEVDPLADLVPVIVLVSDAHQAHVDVVQLGRDLQRAVRVGLGFASPPVVVRFSAQVEPVHVHVLLNEMRAATLGIVFGRHRVAAFEDDAGALGLDCVGIVDPAVVPLREPALAWWVAAADRARVEGLGYLTGTAQQVLEDRFVRVIARNITELFGVQETKNVLDLLETRHPELLKETYRHMPVIRLAEIFQRLLGERVPLRNARLVLEAVAQWAPREKDTLVLAEHVRAALAKTISQHFLAGAARRVIVVAPDSEDRVRASIRQVSTGSFLQMPGKESDAFVAAVGLQFERLNLHQASDAVLLCAVDIRRFVKKLVERRYPDLDVVSFAEVADDTGIEVVGSV